jgi:hypothetical protein
MRVDVRKWVSVGLAAALGVHALSTQVLAQTQPGVPEIDPASISTGIALLTGGALVLRARLRSK